MCRSFRTSLDVLIANRSTWTFLSQVYPCLLITRYKKNHIVQELNCLGTLCAAQVTHTHAFSSVPLNCLPDMMPSHTGCSCLTSLHCVFQRQKNANCSGVELSRHALRSSGDPHSVITKCLHDIRRTPRRQWK